MPRATKEERDARDAMVLQLFLAGVPYRQIGQRANLSVGGVHKVVKRQMELAASRREFLATNALEVYRERLEVLFSRAYQKTTDKNLKAGEQLKAMEVSRRYLDMMGRLDGVNDELGGLPPGPPPAGDDDEDADADVDDLEAFRRRARGAS